MIEGERVNLTGRRAFLKNVALSSLGGGCLGRGMAQDVTTPTRPLVTDFGVCTLHSNFAMLKQVGYSYVEAHTRRLLQPDQPDEKVAAVLEGIQKENIRIHACNNFIPFELKSTGAQANHEAIMKYVEIVFQRAQKISVKAFVFGSGRSRKLPKGFNRAKGEAQFVSLLNKMMPLAEKHGLEIWLEPLNRGEDNLLNTQKDAANFIEKVGHPALGSICDLFHATRNNEDPAELKKYIKNVKHCHIAEKKKRTPPGVEKYNFKPYFRALKEGGYSSTMSVECRWRDLDGQAADALKYIQNQIKTL